MPADDPQIANRFFPDEEYVRRLPKGPERSGSRNFINEVMLTPGASALAQMHGVPVPGMSSGLAYLDSYRSARLPQNLTQAQRDAFGAHTYQRRDDPEGPFVHTDWL